MHKPSCKHLKITLNIKQEYFLMFLSLNIDSHAYWQIFMTSFWTISILKQMPDVTYWEKKRWCRVYTLLAFLHWPDPIYFILIQFFDWPAMWTFLGKHPRSHLDSWYSECSKCKLCQFNKFKTVEKYWQTHGRCTWFPFI